MTKSPKKQHPNQQFRRRVKSTDESMRNVRRTALKQRLTQRQSHKPPRQGSYATQTWLLALGMGFLIVALTGVWWWHSRTTNTFDEWQQVTLPQQNPKQTLPPNEKSSPPVHSPSPSPKESESRESGLRTSNVEALIQRLKPAVALVRVWRGGNSGGEGTGFIINANGYLLTCQHVIADARRIEVLFSDRQTSSGTVVWRDNSRDLALLQVQRSQLPVISLGDAQFVAEGHSILAIGYPLGSSLGMSPTITTGVVSAIRSAPNFEAIQISAPVNPGNSGGPLVSTQTGLAIGVVNAKILMAEGLGFAVPITSQLRAQLETMMR
jgi:S1-C subfamily serine protease